MYSISAVNTPYNLNKASVEDAYGARFSKGYQGVGRSIRDVADVIVAKVWSPSIFKNGTRDKESFLCSNWCVLDFDEGMTLNDALNTFCDTQHIIGTTKSHQTEKNGLICDRFRVCIPWEKQIIDAEHYQQNIERMINHYDTDTSCSDPARLFYPCTSIISINDDPDAYKQEVSPLKKKQVLSKQDLERKRIEHQENKCFPNWVRLFLQKGILTGKQCSKSRNWMVYAVAIELVDFGYNDEEIFHLINQAPFSRDGFKEENIHRRIKSARKRRAAL